MPSRPSACSSMQSSARRVRRCSPRRSVSTPISCCCPHLTVTSRRLSPVPSTECSASPTVPCSSCPLWIIRLAGEGAVMSKLIDNPSSTLRELESSPILSALLKQLPVGVIVASPNGQCTYENDIAAALRNEHAEPLRWAIARALLTGEVIRDEEVEYVDAHGEPRVLSVSATPLADG